MPNDLSREGIAETVRNVISEHLEHDPLTIEDDEKSIIDDFGGDPLDELEITMLLEEEFSVQIPDDDYGTINSYVVVLLTLKEG